MILSVINQKGGVGKTTSVINTAACAAKQGKKTLVVDMDPSANASTMLGVRAESAETSIYATLMNAKKVPLKSVVVDTPISGVSLVPAHSDLGGLELELGRRVGRENRLRDALQPLRGEYDLVIIDNGPTLGLPTALSLVASDTVLIPVKCESLSLEGLAQITKIIEVTRERYNPLMISYVLLTMLDNRTSHGPANEEVLREAFGSAVLTSAIPQSADLAKGVENRAVGSAVIHYAPRSVAATAYEASTAQLLGAK